MPSIPFPHLLRSAAEVFKHLTTIQPKEAKVTVGLDIGSTSVKVVALGPRTRMGPRPILGQNLAPLDATQATDASEAIRSAVNPILPPVHLVNLAVSGQWVIIRIIEMPVMKPAEMKQALPFEAQRYLPFNIEDVVIDGAVLGPADAHKMWVLIIACKKELIERRLDWVRRAGLDAALIDVDALAIANGLLASVNGRSAEGTRGVVNVGAQMTNLVIFKEETPYLIRDIPWGGEKLIRYTAEHLGAEAAAVSKELTQGSPSAEMLNAMKLATEALVTELQLSFDYFENRFGQPPEELLVSGGLSQSTAFVDALKSYLTQKIGPWSPVAGLSGQFAVAYGLALRTS